jgi:hypothetical protein
MKFTGPEEGGVVAVSRIPRPGLVGIFAAGLDVASPSRGRGEGAESGRYNGT